jgi:hypothetical protein
MTDSINKNKNMPVKWTPFVDHTVPATLVYHTGGQPAKFTTPVSEYEFDFGIQRRGRDGDSRLTDSINKNKNMPVKWTPFVDHIVPATLGSSPVTSPLNTPRLMNTLRQPHRPRFLTGHHSAKYPAAYED